MWAPTAWTTAPKRPAFSAARRKNWRLSISGAALLVGDVDPLDVAEKAAAYTPVPGGVGPLTIAMLMANTVASAERRAGVC